MLGKLYETLLTKVDDGNKCVMLTYLDLYDNRKGFIKDKVLLTSEDVERKSFSLPDDVYERICLSLDTGKLQTISMAQTESIIIEPFIPKPRLIVFGGGHIALPLSEFASRVGFSVTVIDDRPSFANTGRFPKAERVICESFEKSFNLINLRNSDFVVIITRGHRYDGVVLREVLAYDLSYIGMIGSKRRVRGMMEELSGEGFPMDKLDFVNAPIGLDIGAITPDEIAISIVSQLISFKNKGVINKFGKDFTFPEFDSEVAEKIFEESSMPKALITILSTKGSVPRQSGAKMVAYYDG
jgi:xanthine dehydrogenase accessory factor